MIDAIIEFFIYAIFPYFKRKKRKKEEWYGKDISNGAEKIFQILYLDIALAK